MPLGVPNEVPSSVMRCGSMMIVCVVMVGSLANRHIQFQQLLVRKVIEQLHEKRDELAPKPDVLWAGNE